MFVYSICRKFFLRAHINVIDEHGMTLSPRDAKSSLVASVCTEFIVSSLKRGILWVNLPLYRGYPAKGALYAMRKHGG